MQEDSWITQTNGQTDGQITNYLVMNARHGVASEGARETNIVRLLFSTHCPSTSIAEAPIQY